MYVHTFTFSSLQVLGVPVPARVGVGDSKPQHHGTADDILRPARRTLCVINAHSFIAQDDGFTSKRSYSFCNRFMHWEMGH